MSPTPEVHPFDLARKAGRGDVATTIAKSALDAESRCVIATRASVTAGSFRSGLRHCRKLEAPLRINPGGPIDLRLRLDKGGHVIIHILLMYLLLGLNLRVIQARRAWHARFPDGHPTQRPALPNRGTLVAAPSLSQSPTPDEQQHKQPERTAHHWPPIF
jgi:hypothetical protein